MSSHYVVDTHALFWYLVDSPRLSDKARSVFKAAFAGQTTLILPTIVLLELYGLAQKVNAPFNFTTELTRLQQAPFQVEPLGLPELQRLDEIKAIPELHDRIIAVTALRLDAPILTRDSLITACEQVRCIW